VLDLAGHWLLSPFADFAFMRRALVGCVLLGFSTAPLGVFLMLRRMSLTGDVMAHAILPGAAIGYLLAGLSLPAMTLGGLVAGAVVAGASGLVSRATALREDASLAAFYLVSLALGVLLVSLKGTSVDLMRFLFGNVLALDAPALALMAGVAALTVPVFLLVYRGLVADGVDPGFLPSLSGSRGHLTGSVLQLVLLMLVVLNLVAGFQAFGTLLVVGVMMLPAVSARFWSRSLPRLIVIAALMSAGASSVGLLLSYHLDLAAGPAVILVAGGFYAMSVVAGPVHGLLTRRAPRRHRTA